MTSTTWAGGWQGAACPALDQVEVGHAVEETAQDARAYGGEIIVIDALQGPGVAREIEHPLVGRPRGDEVHRHEHQIEGMAPEEALQKSFAARDVVGLDAAQDGETGKALTSALQLLLVSRELLDIHADAVVEEAGPETREGDMGRETDLPDALPLRRAGVFLEPARGVPAEMRVQMIVMHERRVPFVHHRRLRAAHQRLHLPRKRYILGPEKTGMMHDVRTSDDGDLGERGFRTLVENSPDMISRLDGQCRFLYANPAAMRALGRASVAGFAPAGASGKTTGSWACLKTSRPRRKPASAGCSKPVRNRSSKSPLRATTGSTITWRGRCPSSPRRGE